MREAGQEGGLLSGMSLRSPLLTEPDTVLLAKEMAVLGQLPAHRRPVEAEFGAGDEWTRGPGGLQVP